MELEWQENASEKPMTWDEANVYVKSLGDGWRLPTIEELRELYNDNSENNRTDYYWVSGLNINGVSYSFGLSFFGSVGYYDSTKPNHVRCVRNIKN